MNLMLRSALAATALAASFAASATDDRSFDGRHGHRPPPVTQPGDGPGYGSGHGSGYGPGYGPGYGERANFQGDIDARQARQEWRIRQAWHRGDLTRREFRILRSEKQEIERFESWAQRDGRIGWREQRELHAMLDRTDDSIRRFVRNDVDAPWR